MISHTDGITLRRDEATAIVGATVVPSSGSTSSPASGEIERASSSAVSAVGGSPSQIAARNASVSGPSSRGGR